MDRELASNKLDSVLTAEAKTGPGRSRLVYVAVLYIAVCTVM
jgi:hypothetical protein